MTAHSYLPPIFALPPTGYRRTATRCYLYAVEVLEIGVVKVGVTFDPAPRLNKHVADAWAYRRHIGRAWVGKHSFRVDAVEADLVRRLGSGLSRSEYVNASFDDVAQLAAAGLGVPGIYPAKVERMWLRNAPRIVDQRTCPACGAGRQARVEWRTRLMHECLGCGEPSELPDYTGQACGDPSGSSGLCEGPDRPNTPRK